MVKKLLKKVGKAAAVAGAGALALKGMKKKSMPGKRGGMSLKTGDARAAKKLADFDRKMSKIAKAGGVSKLKMGGAVKSGTQQLTGFGKARRR
jgi:hypothetical protein